MTEDVAHVILARLEQIQADLAALHTARIGRSDVMDFQEALKYLKIRPGTLRDWIRLRRIPFHRAGRRILFQGPRPRRLAGGTEEQAKRRCHSTSNSLKQAATSRERL